jgi:GPH family glycoside/pentoside/hexuronide:cation symporter
LGKARYVGARYGALGLPLAFASLPLYVHVPAFYATQTGLGLGHIGAILLAVRLMDMVADPLIGSFSDRFQNRRRAIQWGAVPVFALGFAALFQPPVTVPPALWLAGTLILVYAGYSAIAVNYYALGVGMADRAGGHTRLALWREGAMLLGVVLASLLPSLLTGDGTATAAYTAYGMIFACLLPLAALITLTLPFPESPVASQRVFPFSVLRLVPVRWALAVTFFNALPAAITSTLFVFFVTDVLEAPSHAGGLLALYFLSAVAGIPLWSRLGARLGLAGSILAAMLFAIVVFFWAWRLGPGDLAQFYLICFLSGLSLGADTVLLPALFAGLLDDTRGEAGAAFGWWHFLNKASLALAAGIMLPLLAFGGYAPDVPVEAGTLALLSAAYALAPCVCKAIAAALLYFGPLYRPIHLKRSHAP